MGRKARSRTRLTPIMYTEPTGRAVWGYCRSNSHKGYLVKKAIDGHKCIEKGCPKFEKCNQYLWDNLNSQIAEKCIKRYYRKKRESLCDKYKDVESFISAIKEYYNGLHNVPIKEGGGVDISKFIEDYV